MTAVELVVGLVLTAFLGTLAFGLLTGRIPWRVNGCCCPPDPSQDLRMSGSVPRPVPCSTGDEPL
ncbi:MAG: hypothetical protein ACJ72Y_06715 [Actinomycetes bacterium]